MLTLIDSNISNNKIITFGDDAGIMDLLIKINKSPPLKKQDLQCTFDLIVNTLYHYSFLNTNSVDISSPEIWTNLLDVFDNIFFGNFLEYYNCLDRDVRLKLSTIAYKSTGLVHCILEKFLKYDGPTDCFNLVQKKKDKLSKVFIEFINYVKSVLLDLDDSNIDYKSNTTLLISIVKTGNRLNLMDVSESTKTIVDNFVLVLEKYDELVVGDYETMFQIFKLSSNIYYHFSHLVEKHKNSMRRVSILEIIELNHCSKVFNLIKLNSSLINIDVFSYYLVYGYYSDDIIHLFDLVKLDSKYSNCLIYCIFSEYWSFKKSKISESLVIENNILVKLKYLLETIKISLPEDEHITIFSLKSIKDVEIDNNKAYLVIGYTILIYTYHYELDSDDADLLINYCEWIKQHFKTIGRLYKKSLFGILYRYVNNDRVKDLLKEILDYY